MNKITKSWLLSWLYFFSTSHGTCKFMLYVSVFTDDCLWIEYKIFLRNKLGSTSTFFWSPSSQFLEEHSEYSGMNWWQLRHARRKLVHEFFTIQEMK